jgi:hypothetical protein
MRQRQTWNLRHHHRLRRILCHPDRQLRQGAVGLTDGHSDIVTTAIATGYDDRLPVTGMKSVTDNRLAQLIVSIMKLSRRCPARSSIGGNSRPLTYRNAVLQEKAADLIDHGRSLADQARSHPVQCL